MGRLSIIMTKDNLIETIQRLLKTDAALSFLLKLEEYERERLVVCVRERVEQASVQLVFASPLRPAGLSP